MTALDTKLRATASKLIALYGKSVTLTSVSSGAYNTATQSTATTSTASTEKATIEDYSNGAVFASGGLIVMGDKKLTFAAADVSMPAPGGMVTIDDVVWSIKSVKEIWSGEQVAAYEVQVRK